MGGMAIPKGKNVAVQLVVSFAAGAGFAMLVRVAWYLVRRELPHVGLVVAAGLAFAAAFYWWYGRMQQRLTDGTD
jgi:thiol:disulfide interchange protein